VHPNPNGLEHKEVILNYMEWTWDRVFLKS